MGILASLRVLLGADTIDFKKKMTEAGQSAGFFENSFGQRSTLIEKHSMRIANTATSVTVAMQRMSTDSIGAIQQLADSAGFGKVALVVAAIAAVYKTWKGAVDAVVESNKIAKAPTLEMAEAIASNGLAFHNAWVQYRQLLGQFEISGPEWDVGTLRTVANAQAILHLTQRVIEEARERKKLSGELETYNIKQAITLERVTREKALRAESVTMLHAAKVAQEQFNQAHGKFIPASLQVQIALAAGKAQMKEFAEETRRTWSIWNEKDVITQATALKDQFAAVARSGGSMTQVVEKMGPKFTEVLTVAKELGVQLPPGFEDIASAIAKGPGLALEDVAARFKAIPETANAAALASTAALDAMGEKLKGSISGGFGQGAEEGISYAQQALDKWRAEIEAAGIMIPLKLDLAEAARQMELLRRGEIPKTGMGV